MYCGCNTCQPPIALAMTACGEFLMERTKILELMSRLKLYGMRAAYDEVMTTGIKRRHEPPRIVGDLLSAEIAEKQARSIKYQLTNAKLPLAKTLPRRRPGTSTTSTLPAPRSTRRWSATWRAVLF